MSAIPTLETERLLLRPFRLTDASEVQRLAGHPKVAETTATIPHPYPDGAAEEWISQHEKRAQEQLGFDWAMTDKQTGYLIGCISLAVAKSHERAELGYWVGVENWNKGYCSEAAHSVISCGLEQLKLNKITSHHLASNPASGRVMEKAGMVQEGYMRRHYLKDGIFHDLAFYGILRSGE